MIIYCHDANAVQEVREATQYLLSVVIPNCASELDSNIKEVNSPKGFITAVRRKGINTRYLGVLRSYLTHATARSIALAVIISHVLKIIWSFSFHHHRYIRFDIIYIHFGGNYVTISQRYLQQ